MINQISYIGTVLTSSLDPADWGQKASGLARMAHLGISVPPAFVLPVSFCEEYYMADRTLPVTYQELISSGMSYLQKMTGKTFGDTKNPLLVSIRSGAPVSLPGMMETLLNVGISPVTIEGLIYSSGSPRFSWDCYRRYIEQAATTVFGVPVETLHEVKRRFLQDYGYSSIQWLDFSELARLCLLYEKNLLESYDIQIPAEPRVQLDYAVKAVLNSWEADRAMEYRQKEGIDGVSGTAIIVQAMVFGNASHRSGAGIAFTRNPWNGDREMVIDFKYLAQGEEIVSGRSDTLYGMGANRLSPSNLEALRHSAEILEKFYRDMQDIEFTLDSGNLFILQTRNGKRTSFAALKIAVDMVREGLLDPQTALGRIKAIPRKNLIISHVSTEQKPVVMGISASIGVVSGRVAFSREQAESLARDSRVILILNTATPDDIPALYMVSGLVTRLGSRISHAAVIARQMEKVCIVGCQDIRINQDLTSCQINDTIIRISDCLTLDGNSGAIYQGNVTISQDYPDDLCREVRGWLIE